MTPVFAAIPVDTLIWIVLLLIGAIGSIATNAKKAANARRPAVPAAARPTPPPVVVTVAPPTPPPPVVPRRIVPMTPPAAAATPPPPQPVPAPHGTQRFRGMFERGNLVRAIVAAEVLGPPKSLQEQSIWSPRHSEPSI